MPASTREAVRRVHSLFLFADLFHEVSADNGGSIMNTDVQGNQGRLQQAQTLVERYIQSLVEKDVESWMSLWDEHGVMEFPFAPQDRLRRVEGKAALSPYIQGVLKDLEIVSISQQQIYLTQDSDLIIAEITGEGRVLSTGRVYSASYVWIMRTKDGKLFRQRDYWNPLTLLEARGDLDIAKQKMNAYDMSRNIANPAESVFDA